MYGDGSDGALNVSSGTTNLNLDQKYQYTTVNVASGATLSTTSTTGSVLYILATTSITIDGTIDVSSKVNAGQNSWSTTIDGVTYTSPSTAAGGSGGRWYNSPAAPQGFGFGGGGQGGCYSNDTRGGLGALGGPTAGSGGSSVFQAATGSVVYRSGISASPNSAGGSGALVISASSGSATSGTGGAAYGNNGANASYSIDSGIKLAAGGGGAGGSAGRPGVHVVLKAPVIVINGAIITSGTAGQNGGNGGNVAENVAGSIEASSGGGGGGGGNAGSAYLYYSLTLNDSGTYTMAAGVAGSAGALGNGITANSTAAASGAAGNAGAKMVRKVNFYVPTPTPYVYDGTNWVPGIAAVYDGGNFIDRSIEVL